MLVRSRSKLIGLLSSGRIKRNCRMKESLTFPAVSWVDSISAGASFLLGEAVSEESFGD